MPFVIGRFEERMPIIRQVLTLVSIGVGVALLIVALTTQDWYNDHSTQNGEEKTDLTAGIFRLCRKTTTASNTEHRVAVESCDSIVDLVDKNSSSYWTNGYNHCEMSGKRAATYFHVSQAFGISTAGIAVLLFIAAIFAALFPSSPLAVVSILMFLDVACAVVLTSVYYSAMHCLYATETSDAGASLVICWIGIFFVLVGGLILSTAPAKSELVLVTDDYNTINT